MVRFLYWIPALTYAALIFLLSDSSRPPGVGLAPDYLLHFIEYGFFTITVIIGTTQFFKIEMGWKESLLVVMIVFLYAAFDEYHQTFIPSRDGSLRDWVSDSVAAVFTVSITLLFQSRIRGLLKR